MKLWSIPISFLLLSATAQADEYDAICGQKMALHNESFCHKHRLAEFESRVRKLSQEQEQQSPGSNLSIDDSLRVLIKNWLSARK
ncbi:hypothetical protein J8Z82_09060 [Yersinia enterocolitica]|uniref:hypothetical protein n=1 Tax=Yersinia enterocolitica TaxID=630 RepID=UPI001C8EF34F|nr:hypothetical protein [Yersinia enterocolitica]MBX9488916.1 hypothetical protein [Yersinia enterocolitica]MBX9491936.1 hypothetical protein [Yersinia enterocolitica]